MTKTWNEAAHEAANRIADDAVRTAGGAPFNQEVALELLEQDIVWMRGDLRDARTDLDDEYARNARCAGAHALGILADRVDRDVWVLADEIAQLAARKHHDYGVGNISAFGVQGLIVRTSDKVERLKNLLDRKDEPSNESIDDTLTDIVGYAIVGTLWVNGTFELPLAEDVAAATSGSFDKILDATILSYGDLVLSGEPRMGKLIAAPERSPLLQVNDEFNALVQEWNRQLDEHVEKARAAKANIAAAYVAKRESQGVWPVDFQRNSGLFRVDL